MADYLAVGIDPARSTIFAHSQVAALNQLLVPFLSLVSVAELARNPTVKDETAAAGCRSMSGPDVHLPGPPGRGHPVLQGQRGPGRQGPAPAPGADPADRPPLQPALQPAEPLFPEPDALLSDAPALLGTDGQKMSKSRGNAITIAPTPTRPPG